MHQPFTPTERRTYAALTIAALLGFAALGNVLERVAPQHFTHTYASQPCVK